MRNFFLFLFLFFSISLFGKSFTVNGEEQSPLKSYYEYSYVDDLNETPQTLENRQWQENLKLVSDKNIKSAYWIRFSAHNNLKTSKELFLLSERSYIYRIDYYLMQKQKLIKHYYEGYHQKSKVDSDGVTQRIFPLVLDANESMDIYFKIQSFNKINLDFQLFTKEELLKYEIKYNLLQGIFFGVMLIMIIYNLILYLLLGFKPYIYYVVYVSSFTVFAGSYLGYFHQYTPIPTVIVHMLISLSISMFLFFIVEFLKETFLMEKYLSKTLLKIIYFIQWALLGFNILAMLMIFLDNFSYIELFANLFYVMVMFLYLFISYALLLILINQKNKLVYYYLILWLLLGFIGLMQVLANANIWISGSQYYYIFETGMMVESVIFSLLLGHNIKEINEEKEKQNFFLIQQSKLASIGETISLIAHQWRQPLSEMNGIVLSIDIDYRKNKLTAKRLEKHLDNIEEVTSYLSKTINDFMELSRPSKEVEKFTLQEVIHQSRQLSKRSIISTFELNCSDCQNQCEIELVGYKSEFIQALLIIFHNAIDAAKEQDILVSISIRASVKDGYLFLEIEDNCGGIDNDIIEKIYNPYFTTKHKSQGTGLGLYILKMIIEKSMDGEIEVKNVNLGVIVTLRIPLIIK